MARRQCRRIRRYCVRKCWLTMILLPVTTAVAATAVTVLGSMYLDAKLLLTHDLMSGALNNVSGAALKFTQQRMKEDRMTVYDDIERHAKSATGATNLFLMFEDRSWTYKQFYDDLQRVGNWLMKDLDIQRGEVVAIDGGNSPELVMLWFALEALGAIPAFINCNLTSKPLVHCVKVGKTRYLLADRDVQSLVQSSEEELGQEGCNVVYYDETMFADFKDTTELPQSRRSQLPPWEVAMLIYTSGTTGMPKAVLMLRSREINTARGISAYLGLKPGNRMYTCLPLYHGAAHGLCVTPCVYAGSTVVLSRKFSHKTFWSEVRESKADVLQYVGELCRYLINAPPSPLDKKHNVRKAWGNGMRPDVWEVFRQRFGIEAINELYAATDGMGGSFNNNRGDFGRFAIGQRGALWRFVNSKFEKRVKIDVVTQDIVRDKNGFAIECEDGEPGEVVHRLDPATEHIVFAGYFNNKDATQKRKIRDLFKTGDLWFRSGDVMRQDPDGCVYFVDRLGDTFRWKSENVSTNEVGDVMGSFDQIAEANVYGVQIPFTDGRCGCAAIVLAEGVTEQQLDLGRLAQHAINTLPRYAVPIFIRLTKELQYTGTMKVQKGKLREEGIDLEKVSADSSIKDSIYWLPPGQSVYVPFKQKQWEELKAGKVRL